MSLVVVGTSLAPRDQEKAWNKITCVNVTSNIITERLISEPAEQSFLGRGGAPATSYAPSAPRPPAAEVVTGLDLRDPSQTAIGRERG